MKLFNRNREPTTNQKPNVQSRFQMISTFGEHYYSWNGNLYQSDIVRACIRPKVKAIGKLVGKHIREDPKKGLKVNPEAYIRFLLTEPNPLMTGQQFQEKMANQLCLNNNAFALIVRDENGYPMQLYPIPCVSVEAIYDKQYNLFLEFQYRNGKKGVFDYNDIIHLRQDYYDNDIFGSTPAPALAELMECVGVIDQGIVKAIKNSSVVRWLLKFNTSLRPEDIKKNVDEFVNNYLSVESDTFGAAGVDSKADAIRIEPKDFVPNATQTDRTIDRIYSFFNTNKKIVQSSWTEDDWTAYYEAEIEPAAIQFGAVYTVRLFTRKERGFGNQIVFEASNLQCASLNTKLGFMAMVDRGAMLPNEWRSTLNMAPIEGGDKPIRRLDTQVVDMVNQALDKMDNENCAEMAALIGKLLDAAGSERG
ncbi:phage portal protein [uncultured Robinsoniella sp.]|uniref:phage portal protein n=1 Tax=uncultured Robinsoniella sp. TaxID=904190 RepID=UPI00374E8542